jgi:hypothetical protein
MPASHSNQCELNKVNRLVLLAAAIATCALSGCAIVPYPPGFHRAQEILIAPPRIVIEPGWRYAERPRHHHNHY